MLYIRYELFKQDFSYATKIEEMKPNTLEIYQFETQADNHFRSECDNEKVIIGLCNPRYASRCAFSGQKRIKGTDWIALSLFGLNRCGTPPWYRKSLQSYSDANIIDPKKIDEIYSKSMKDFNKYNSPSQLVVRGFSKCFTFRLVMYYSTMRIYFTAGFL